MAQRKRGSGRPPKYKLLDGTIVPGVTTITGRFKDAGGLIHWAWSQGMDGIDYRRTRDAAGDAGTLAHALIEAQIHSVDPEIPDGTDEETLGRAKQALANFTRWTEQTRLCVTHTEVPLVSERYKYGGTIDAIGTVAGTLALVDWKSSSAIYADYLVQCAAYVQLWEEHHPSERLNELHLLRVDKEFAGFHHHSWSRPVIDVALQFFLRARELYDLDRMLKKAAA